MGQKSKKAELNDPRDFGVLPEDRRGEGASLEDASGATSADVNGTAAGAGGDDAHKLSRIRDLLFGEAARDHTRRLDSVEATLGAALASAEERFQHQLDAAVAAADAARIGMKEAFDSEVERLEGALAATRSELRAAQAALETQARGKVERSDFASMLGELAKRVGEAESEDDS